MEELLKTKEDMSVGSGLEPKNKRLFIYWKRLNVYICNNPIDWNSVESYDF